MTDIVLRSVVAELARRAGIRKTPVVRVYHSVDASASTAWIGFHEIRIADSLLARTEAHRASELIGVIAHEVGHIAAGDGFRAAAIRAIVVVDAAMAVAVHCPAAALCALVTILIYAGFIRHAEYGADSVAASLVGPYGLAGWLMRRRNSRRGLHPSPLLRAHRLLIGGSR
jgi:Zn-dependent protease with chaperone function